MYTDETSAQIELKLKYKFRLILDETWSYGVLGRTGGGVTEAQNVDAAEVDMVIGSLSGPLCAAGGFCAGNDEVVEHQRISSASYTYSAALPALLSTTASETISLLQEQPEILSALRENVKAMRAQLDPRSDWVRTRSAPDNPMLLLTLKPEVVEAKKLSVEDQNHIFRDVVDEVGSPFPVSVFRHRNVCFANNNTLPTVSRQRRPHHAPQGLPARSWRQPARRGMAAAAVAEGVCYERVDEEGDRKGRHGDSTCDYEDCVEEEVARFVELGAFGRRLTGR
jgi:hypothetical protein